MISPEPLDSSPPLSIPILSASESFNLSSSGSLQTHLSSFNSEQRLRSLPSAAGDLEKQAGSDLGDRYNEVYDDDKRQPVVKQRFWWLARTFVWFSALFFPISVLGNYGFLSHRQSVNSLTGYSESGLHCCQKDWVLANELVRLPTLSLGKRATLVQDNHP